MKTQPLKIMRVKSPHFAEGVLINQERFDPTQHVKMDIAKPARKPAKVSEKKEVLSV